MLPRALPVAAIACVEALLLGACMRDAPPEIPALPLIPKAVVEVAKVETVEETPSTPAPPPLQAPKIEVAKPPPPPPEKKPIEAPVAVKPEAPAAKEPTIIGTWKVVEGTEHGRPMPMEMNMTFTFAEGGTVAMSMSMPQMPEPRSMNGTYSLSGDQITISMDNETKTGKLTFEGQNRASIEIDEAKLVMEKQ